MRQTARRWDSVKMRTKIMGTRLAATKPMSIWTLVKRMKYLCVLVTSVYKHCLGKLGGGSAYLFLCPAFSSPELSAQATLPAGYSPLFYPRSWSAQFKKLLFWASRSIHPIPIPIKNRYAVSAANIPPRLP